MKYFEISYMWKAKTNPKTQQLILINWIQKILNFHLIKDNRQKL